MDGLHVQQMLMCWWFLQIYRLHQSDFFTIGSKLPSIHSAGHQLGSTSELSLNNLGSVWSITRFHGWVRPLPVVRRAAGNTSCLIHTPELLFYQTDRCDEAERRLLLLPARSPDTRAGFTAALFLFSCPTACLLHYRLDGSRVVEETSAEKAAVSL